MGEMILELEDKKNALLQGVQDLMKLASTLAKVCSNFITVNSFTRIILYYFNFKCFSLRLLKLLFFVLIGIRNR